MRVNARGKPAARRRSAAGKPRVRCCCRFYEVTVHMARRSGAELRARESKGGVMPLRSAVCVVMAVGQYAAENPGREAGG